MRVFFKLGGLRYVWCRPLMTWRDLCLSFWGCKSNTRARGFLRFLIGCLVAFDSLVFRDPSEGSSLSTLGSLATVVHLFNMITATGQSFPIYPLRNAQGHWKIRASSR